jgi:hypothetical protein
MSQPRGSWKALAATAVVVTVLGGGGVIVALNEPEATPSAPTPPAPEPHGPPEPAPSVVAQHEAADLRKLAKADCDAEQWTDCVGKLNKAQDLDPQGNGTRTVQRMRAQAQRAQIAAQMELEPDSGPAAPRSIEAADRAALAAKLHDEAGVHALLVCSAAQEPAHFCDVLAAVAKKAGWVVSRGRLAADAGAAAPLRIEVATDADDATQAAADALADGLETRGIVARGPSDAPPDPDVPSLRVKVGPQ